MSTKQEKAPIETLAERDAPRTDLDTQGEHIRQQDSKMVRRLSIERIGVAAALVATVVIYVFFLVHPFEPTPQNLFLIFERGNTAIWPMQLVCYASAAVMVGLALWQRRRASQLICLLSAVIFAWVGIVYYGVFDNGMHFAWVWVAVFILEAILFLVAGIVRRDLVFAPCWNLSGVLGAVVMSVGLVGFPLVEVLSGYPLHALTVFGLAPCPTVIFFFGLLLWARPPLPKYLLLLPLAWALTSAPNDLTLGIVAVITVGVLIWRDRTSIWQTVVAGVLLALMIALSGHDDLLIGIALILVAVTFAQALWTDAQRLHADLPPQPERVLTS
jgi:Family of unknown function (DUF6064)